MRLYYYLFSTTQTMTTIRPPLPNSLQNHIKEVLRVWNVHWQPHWQNSSQCPSAILKLVWPQTNVKFSNQPCARSFHETLLEEGFSIRQNSATLYQCCQFFGRVANARMGNFELKGRHLGGFGQASTYGLLFVEKEKSWAWVSESPFSRTRIPNFFWNECID